MVSSMIIEFWKRLSTIRSLHFKATFDQRPVVQGMGSVVVNEEGPNVFLFKEQGSWVSEAGVDVTFSNVYRFTLEDEKIALEQLSRGENHPRFLFYLAASDNGSLESIAPHMCKQDAYWAKVVLEEDSLQMHWRITGPKKNQEIQYYYS